MRVLLIDIDTLRPDHMGCYGYGRQTTPNLDAVAKEGVLFNNYFCSDAPCLPSRAALISGKFGIHSGVVGHGGTCADRFIYGGERGFRNADDSNNLINLFRRNGMHTASISTFAERHSAWWFNAGFNETYNVGKGGQESGEEVLPVALDWIERNAERDNWFLHLNLWDPHTPYRTPDSFGNPFENAPLDTWITEDIFKKHLKSVGPHSVNELNMFDDNVDPAYPKHPGKITEYSGLKALFDGYDSGISHADYLVGRVFDALRGKNVFDDLAVIITADHGESFGEFGIYAEHATADYSTCRIPMIIKWPGGRKNHVDHGLRYNLDLAPTIAELFGLEKYDGWDGESFAKTVTCGESGGRESLVISQMAHVCQRSAIFDGWIYIRTYHDGFHLFDNEMLFNLKDDPYEQNDLKARHPEICEKGAKIILDWHDEMMARSDNRIDPLWIVMSEGGPFHARGSLDKYIERLQKTGRARGAKLLREKYENTDFK